MIHQAPHPSVETAVLEPEVVLYDARHGRVHHLNQTASAVWLALDGERSTSAIARLLAALFGGSVDAVSADVESALDSFASLGLLADDGAPTVPPRSVGGSPLRLLPRPAVP